MRSIHLPLCFLALASDASQFFESGQEYLYMMETSINTGTGDLSPHMSGFTVKGEVLVQAEGDLLNIQITNLRQSYFNGPYAAGYWPYQNMDSRTKYIPVSEEYMKVVFSVLYENGKVKEITMPDDSELWLKNIMRGFASSFQIDMENVESENRAWYSREKTVHGNCDVQYTFERNPNTDYHVVTKAVSHISDCVDRSYKIYNNFYGKSCKNEPRFTPKVKRRIESEDNLIDYVNELNQQYQSPEPMYSDSTTTIFMRPGKDGDEIYTVEKFFTAGAVVVHPFGKKGAAKWTLANRTFILKSVGPSSGNLTVEGTTYQGVAFEWNEEERTWDSDIDLKEKETLLKNGFKIDEEQDTLWNTLYQKIYDFVVEQKNHKTNYDTKEDRDELHDNGIQNLLSFFYLLNYDSLQAVKEKLNEDTSDDGVTAQEIFMELLPLTGTLPSALLVKEYVENDEFANDRLASKALIAVPFHIRRPTKGLVDEWESLLSQDTPQGLRRISAFTSFAHLARHTCELSTEQSYKTIQNEENKFSECVEQLLNPLIEKYYAEFQEVDKDNINELNKYIFMFANFKWGKVSELLHPLIADQTEEPYPVLIRVNALSSVYENVIKDGEEIEYFLPLILDSKEDAEIRVTAFKYLMKGNPDTTTFVKIVTSMLHETNYEVFNFIYTSFEKMAYSWDIEPCYKAQQNLAKYYLRYWRQYMRVKPLYAFAVSKDFSRTFSQEKYGYSGSIEYSTVGHQYSAIPHVFEVEARSQLFEGYSMQLFGIKLRLEGLSQALADKFRQMYFEEWNFEDLQSILFEQIGIQERSKQDMRIELIVSLKNNIIFHQYFDQESFADMFEYLLSFRENFSVNRQLALGFGSVSYEQPSDIGFPVAYYAGMMSTLNVQFDVTNGDGSDYNSLFFRIFNYKLSYNGQVSNSMSVFHQDNTVFTIAQDNVYKHQFDQWTKLAFNRPKTNLKFVFERPEYRRPASFIMHSQSTVSIRTNKLGDVPTSLVRTCPTCQNVQVLTRGDEHKTSRYFVNFDSEEWGGRFVGKLFDCELEEALSQGEMLYNLGESFTWENKEPKDPVTAVVLGLFQMTAYHTYFPKIESCGVNIKWSQSKYHPVTQTEISLTGNVQKIQSGRRYSLLVDVDFQGEVERKHHIALNYEYESSLPDMPMLFYGSNKHSFNVKAGRKPFEVGSTGYPEYAICLKFDQTYPIDDDKYITLELSRPQKVTFDGALSFGFDSSCSNHDKKIVLKSKAATMKDAKRYFRNKWYYTACMEEKKNQRYRSSRSLPLTDACLLTAKDLYTLRKFKTDITTNNLPRWLIKMFRKIEVIMKTKLWAFWQVDLRKQMSSIDYDNYSPWLRTDLRFDPNSGTADLMWMTNLENSEFKGIPYDQNLQYGVSVEDYLPSSTYSLMQGVFMNQGFRYFCRATNDEVRTYTNVTYNYEMHDCWTLLSADCSEQPMFAVFMKKVDENRVAIRMQVKGHAIEIQPSGYSTFTATFDGEEFELDDQESWFFPSQEKMYQGVSQKHQFRVHKWDNSFSIDIPFITTVHYDGIQIQITASPFIKSKQCGICGDFSTTRRFEYVGPQNCLLKSGQEMVDAFSWQESDKDSCPETPECSVENKIYSKLANFH